MSTTPPPPLTRVIMDRFEECIYKPGEVSRCPARVPAEPLSPEQLDLLLEQGDQRVGGTVFRTECPFCHSCEPVRVDVSAFKPSRSQRRVLKQGGEALKLELGKPLLSRKRVALWNRHRMARGLLTDHSRRDPVGYQDWLVESCAPTLEFRYLLGEKLVALSLLDVGRTSANSAYCYFDPAFSDLSIGVYSVLREMQWCAEQGIRWYYLGLWVRECESLRYKTNYAPHERLVRGKWERFERPEPRVEPLPPDALVPLGEGEEAIGTAALGLPTTSDFRRDSE